MLYKNKISRSAYKPIKSTGCKNFTFIFKFAILILSIGNKNNDKLKNVSYNISYEMQLLAQGVKVVYHFWQDKQLRNQNTILGGEKMLEFYSINLDYALLHNKKNLIKYLIKKLEVMEQLNIGDYMKFFSDVTMKNGKFVKY